MPTDVGIHGFATCRNKTDVDAALGRHDGWVVCVAGLADATRAWRTCFPMTQPDDAGRIKGKCRMQSPIVDVTAIIEQQRIGRFAWSLLGWTFVCMLIDGF